MIKRIFLALLLIMLGSLSGIAIIELSMHFVRGNPQSCLFRDFKDDYEMYKPFFRKGRGADGHIAYFTQRTRCSQESFVPRKPHLSKRIIIIGESTAGVFARSKGHFRYVLKKQMPLCDFEILDCSTGGYDSSRIVPVAEEVVGYEPDLLLIFMGNNLWDKPFTKDLWLSNAFFRALYERSWIIHDLHARLLRNRRFQKPAINRNINFRKNYETIIRLAKARGISVILFQLPTNFKDFPPVSCSVMFDKSYIPIQRAIERGDYRNAVAVLSKMQVRSEYSSNPCYTFFMMGKALENLRAFALAKEMYLKAVTLDATPGVRCDVTRVLKLPGLQRL